MQGRNDVAIIQKGGVDCLLSGSCRKLCADGVLSQGELDTEKVFAICIESMWVLSPLGQSSAETIKVLQFGEVTALQLAGADTF